MECGRELPGKAESVATKHTFNLQSQVSSRGCQAPQVSCGIWKMYQKGDVLSMNLTLQCESDDALARVVAMRARETESNR